MDTTTANNTDSTTETTAAGPEVSAVITALDGLRAVLDTEQFVSQGRCIDWLLDLYNLAQRTSVKAMIEVALTDVSHRGLVPVAELRASLDSVELAHMVDCIFDRYEFPQTV